MIERIDLFMPPRSRYQVLHYFTECLAKALTRTGVRCRVLEAQRDQPKLFLDTIFADPPECTLSFNGLLPDQEGHFFCEAIRIPHVACLVDAPHHFAALSQSPRTVITCVDRFSCDFFQGLNCQNVLFMPHGADVELITPPQANEERPYDLLLLASFIDYEKIHRTWKKNLPAALCKALEDAAEITLFDREIPYVQALAQALDQQSRSSSGIDPRTIDFIPLLDQLEDYINGKDRVELIKAIKDVKIEIYGSGSERWKKYLDKSSHVTAHEPVDYQQALKLMRDSKIVLNSCPTIKNGAHERIFAGISAGAAVLTDENPYMHENFKHLDNILFFRHGHWKDVNPLIHAYLTDTNKRLTLVAAGQQVVRAGHTWDHRAAVLVSELGPILQRIS